MEKILVTGAFGQLGSELTERLRNIYGNESVIASDIRENDPNASEYLFRQLDVTDAKRMEAVIKELKVTQVYHLAAILSSVGEQNPKLTWDINMDSLSTLLELARTYKFKIYWPSSIAVFGETSPRVNTPQSCVLEPSTMYGITKLAGEKLCEYYYKKFDVDVRSLRYPGLIGWKSMPGGGTTDYAVEIFHEALKNKEYTSFLSEKTALPMMYMDDAIRGTIELMQADKDKVKVRTSYNFSGISFTPKELSESIKKYIPDFEIKYSPDHRQGIADTWPKSINDADAQKDWNWNNEFDIDKMTNDILLNLKNLVSLNGMKR